MTRIFGHCLLLAIFFTNPARGMERYREEGITIADQSALNSLVLHEFKLITGNYYDRISQVKNTANHNGHQEILRKEFWYTEDYFLTLKALTKGGSPWAKKQLSLFKKSQAFLRGYCDSPFLVRRGNAYTYYLRENALPNEAIETLENYLIFIDCAIAYQLAYYRAALRYLGPDKFNQYFSAHKDMPLLCMLTEKTMLVKMIDRSNLELKDNDGAYLYIYNHPFYLHKNPTGNAQGLNLLVSGKNDHGDILLTGLGLPPGGLTKVEIENFLVKDFNKEPLSKPYDVPRTRKLAQRCIEKFLCKQSITSVEDHSFLPELWGYVAKCVKKKAKATQAITELQQTLRNRSEREVSTGPQLSLTKLKAIDNAY